MRLSRRSEDLLAKCRWIAEKLGNDFISIKHFLLVYNGFRDNDLLDFKVTISDKKEIVKSLKGIKWGVSENENFPLTKDFEVALKTSNFHRWVFSDKEIYPKHIFLSLISEETNNKGDYFNILEENKVKLNKKKRLMIEIVFNSIMRKMGIVRVIRKVV